VGLKTGALNRRWRIARGLDETAMRALSAATGPDAEARIELVMGGARERIACGLDGADLCSILAAAGGGAQIELVFAGSRRGK